MKKKYFQETVETLKYGDVLIVKIRPHQFMPSRKNSYQPFVHCVFVSASAEFLEVHFEGTIQNGGAINGGVYGAIQPNRINYARIVEITKL